MSDPPPAVHILLVEDEEADARLVSIALERADIPAVVHVARDGAAAMEWLRRAATGGPDPWPDLMILDLNVPKKDGREVLAEVKADPALRSLPTMVFTTSSNELDVAFARAHHADRFVVKPLRLGPFLDAVHQFVRPARSDPSASTGGGNDSAERQP